MTPPTVRVVHVLEAVATGCTRHLVDLVGSTEGIEHVVVCPRERRGDVTDWAAFDALRSAGAEIVHVDMRRSTTSGTNVLAVARVARIVRRRRPDVVHGHSSIGGVVARLGALGAAARTVYTPHGLAPGRTATTVERLLRVGTDVLVAVSPSEAELVARLGLVPGERVRVVPNGIAVEAPAPASLRSVLGVDGDVPLVGFVGRLAAQKAPEVFVAAARRAAASVPGAVFVLVGDGPLAPRVDAVAAPNVRRVPHLPGASAYLGDLDVLVQPSRYEGAPYVPLEAMRAGVPVVATDVTGNRDVVVDGSTGLLVPVDDPAALAEAIVRLLLDPDLRRALGAAGRRDQAERFDLAAMGRSYTDLYRALGAEGRRSTRRRTRRPLDE